MSTAVGNKGVVLVVEDEPLLLFYARDILEDAGYEVVAATTADEAVALLERRADIKIVFTDVQMPGSMDGARLAHAIRSRWPPIALVLTSGHVSLTASQMPASSIFLAKPYAEKELRAALSKASSGLTAP